MKGKTENEEKSIEKETTTKARLNGINAIYYLGYNPKRRFICMGILILFFTISIFLFIVFS